MTRSSPSLLDFVGDATTVLDGFGHVFAAVKLGSFFWNDNVRREQAIPWLIEHAVAETTLSPSQREAVLTILRKKSFSDALHRAKNPDAVRSCVQAASIPSESKPEVTQRLLEAMKHLWKLEGSPQEAVLMEGVAALEASADASAANNSDLKAMVSEIGKRIEELTRPATLQLPLTPVQLSAQFADSLKSLGVKRLELGPDGVKSMELNRPAQFSIHIPPGNLADLEAMRALEGGTLQAHRLSAQNGVRFDLTHPVFDLMLGESRSIDSIIFVRTEQVSSVVRLVEFRVCSKRIAINAKISYHHDERRWSLAAVTAYPEVQLEWSFVDGAAQASCTMEINSQHRHDFSDDLQVLGLMAAFGGFQGDFEVWDCNRGEILMGVTISEPWGATEYLLAKAQFLLDFHAVNKGLVRLNIAPLPFPTPDSSGENVYKSLPVIRSALDNSEELRERSVDMLASDLTWDPSLHSGTIGFPLLNVEIVEVLNDEPLFRFMLYMHDPRVDFIPPNGRKLKRIRTLEEFRRRYPDGHVRFSSRKCSAAIFALTP